MNIRQNTQIWLSDFFENVFFSEFPLIRFLRAFSLITFMLAAALLSAYIFEFATSFLELIRKTPPYLLAPLSAVIAAILLGARYMQDIYELPSYGKALHYVLASLFDGPPYSYILPIGWFLPSLTISKGEKVQDGEVSLLDQVGGPGWLTVEPGNAVVLEHLESPTMVLGEGIHFIPRFMRVQEVISLEDQHWTASPVQAATKDGIEITVHDFQFTYRVCANRHENQTGKRTLTDPYPFSLRAVRALAYNRNVRNGELIPWGSSLQFRIDGRISEYINRHTIDEVLAPTAEDPRNSMMEGIYSSELRTLLRDTFGTELIWANVGRFEISDELIREAMKNYRTDSWFAQWDAGAALLLAQGKARQIAQDESGRSEGTASMLKTILQSLDEIEPKGEANDHLWNIVLAGTAQVIESMTSIYDTEMKGHSDNGNGAKYE